METLKRRVPAQWSGAVLVCSKCSKKLGGGFGPKGKQSLAKALRRHLGLGKGRKSPIGIVEVKCLGVCPGNAVTVVNMADAREWLLVRPGADMDAVAHELGIEKARAKGDA